MEIRHKRSHIIICQTYVFLEFFSQNVLILKFPNKNLLEFSNTVK